MTPSPSSASGAGGGGRGEPSEAPGRAGDAAPLASAEDLTALSAETLYLTGGGGDSLNPAAWSGLPSSLTLGSGDSRLPSDLSLSGDGETTRRRPLRAASARCLRRMSVRSGGTGPAADRATRGVSAPIEAAAAGPWSDSVQ